MLTCCSTILTCISTERCSTILTCISTELRCSSATLTCISTSLTCIATTITCIFRTFNLYLWWLWKATVVKCKGVTLRLVKAYLAIYSSQSGIVSADHVVKPANPYPSLSCYAVSILPHGLQSVSRLNTELALGPLSPDDALKHHFNP